MGSLPGAGAGLERRKDGACGADGGVFPAMFGFLVGCGPFEGFITMGCWGPPLVVFGLNLWCLVISSCVLCGCGW